MVKGDGAEQEFWVTDLQHAQQTFDVTDTGPDLCASGAGPGAERIDLVHRHDRAALEGSREREWFAGRAEVGEQGVQGRGDPLAGSDGVVVGGAKFGCLPR